MRKRKERIGDRGDNGREGKARGTSTPSARTTKKKSIHNNRQFYYTLHSKGRKGNGVTIAFINKHFGHFIPMII
jgi:hypothetical protein